MTCVFALKNIGFDIKDNDKKYYQSIVTQEFLYKILSEEALSILRE